MPPKVIRARLTKQERKHQRAPLGALSSHVLKSATRRRYEDAVNDFSHWCLEHRVPFPSSREECCGVLGDYLEFFWTEGHGKAKAANVLCAMQFRFVYLKNHLQWPWRLYSAWQRLELPLRAVPLSVELLQAFCGHLLFAGVPRLALMLAVGFHCLLRPNELSHARVRDIRFYSRQQLAEVTLHHTKGAPHGSQSVMVDDPQTLFWLRSVLRHLRPTDLHSWHIRPHSIRRGGATYHYSVAQNLDLLTTRGRWKQVKTARVYLDQAAADLPTDLFTPQQVALVARARAVFAQCVCQSGVHGRSAECRHC
eukprot:6488902-Amphidinium_carterae.4